MVNHQNPEFVSIRYLRSGSDKELAQILRIQKDNIRTELSADEIEQEGFVTLVHDLELLRQMNQVCPHIIATADGLVIGYALAMAPVFRGNIPLLQSLFDLLDRLVPHRNYLVMGQICIDKPFRRKGVFKGLYDYYRSQFMGKYDCLVTEVASENQRSLGAHISVGFKTIYTRSEHDKDWEVLLWDWEN